MNKKQLIDLARAALQVAEGAAKPEDFPAEIAVHLGEVSIETKELNQSATKIAVRQFVAAADVFMGILLEQGVDPAGGSSDKNKAVHGQLAVASGDLEFLENLLHHANKIRAELKILDSNSS